jgi:hypothetical protein
MAARQLTCALASLIFAVACDPADDTATVGHTPSAADQADGHVDLAPGDTALDGLLDKDEPWADVEQEVLLMGQWEVVSETLRFDQHVTTREYPYTENLTAYVGRTPLRIDVTTTIKLEVQANGALEHFRFDE